MSITDELRELAEGDALRAGMSWRTARDHILAIADRIDAEHDKALNSVDGAYDSGYSAGYDMGLARADDLLAQHEDATRELDEKSILLPVDANGEVIHIGDEMEGIDKYYSRKEVVGRVITISFESDGTVEVAIRVWDSAGKSWHRAYLDPYASVYRHVRKPTVDGILRDFGADISNALDADPDKTVPEEIIAAYAAKLRVAESEEQ
jgi:hypothetical protein